MDKLIATEFFKALSDNTRLKLIIALRDKNQNTLLSCQKNDKPASQSMCVCELTELLNKPQPTVSRHLNQLKRVGILTRERRGTWMWYGINNDMPKWCTNVINQIELCDE